MALGLRPDMQVRTLADLVPVSEELAPEHLDDALHRHARNFSALLAPPASEFSADVTGGLVRASVALLVGTHDAVILHVPRTLDEVALAGLRMADEVLLVTTQDLFSLYGAKRTMWQLQLDATSDRCRILINRFGRGQPAPLDMARVLGVRPWGAVRFDPAVRRAQDVGELLPPRSRRAGRDVRGLAHRLVPLPRGGG